MTSPRKVVRTLFLLFVVLTIATAALAQRSGPTASGAATFGGGGHRPGGGFGGSIFINTPTRTDPYPFVRNFPGYRHDGHRGDGFGNIDFNGNGFDKDRYHDGSYGYGYGYGGGYYYGGGSGLVEPWTGQTATDRVLINGGTFNSTTSFQPYGYAATSSGFSDRNPEEYGGFYRERRVYREIQSPEYGENQQFAGENRGNTVEQRGARPGERMMAQARPEGPATTPNSLQEKTVIVLRDGTKREIANYAVYGGNVVVVGSGTTERIPLQTIDLQATQQANRAIGGDFHVPAPVKTSSEQQ